MSRWERSGERDLAFSQWHRENFHDQADAFDVDLVGICHSYKCRTPLYKIESTRAAQKATTMLEGVCSVSKTPGILVQYSTNDEGELVSMVARLVWPEKVIIGDADMLRKYLAGLRDIHDRYFHLSKMRASA